MSPFQRNIINFLVIISIFSYGYLLGISQPRYEEYDCLLEFYEIPLYSLENTYNIPAIKIKTLILEKDVYRRNNTKRFHLDNTLQGHKEDYNKCYWDSKGNLYLK